MSKLSRQPETPRPRTLREFTEAARNIADAYIETPSADAAPSRPDVAVRAEALVARIQAENAARRDPYAAEARRAAGIIATRGEDLAAEQVGRPVDPADIERLALLAIENGATPQGAPEWRLDAGTKALGQAQLPAVREALNGPKTQQ